MVDWRSEDTLLSMNNQGLRRVVGNRDPRGYFVALNNWFTEEYHRRVRWSDSIPIDGSTDASQETGVPEEVECCKPEWIERGWKCFECGRGRVPRTVDPYDHVDQGSDGGSSEEAYVISCTPSGRSSRGTGRSGSASSSTAQ